MRFYKTPQCKIEESEKEVLESIDYIVKLNHLIAIIVESASREDKALENVMFLKAQRLTAIKKGELFRFTLLYWIDVQNGICR